MDGQPGSVRVAAGRLDERRPRSRPAALRVRVAALLTGGSVAGFVAVHAVHAAVAGGSVVVGFVCSIPR
jgi:hypothetical protein